MVCTNYRILILLVLSIPIALAQTVTIDDGDAGYATTPGSGGVWGNFVHACGNAGDYDFETTAVPDQTAKWTPVIPSAGIYQVFVHWCVHSARPDAVPYQITHDGGMTNVTVNQQLNATNDASGDFTASDFRSLGTFSFTPNMSQNVMLDTSDTGDVSADAVRFVKIAGTTLHVNGSCSGFIMPCFTTIQAALVNATDGDTIHVYPGTYTEPIGVCNGNAAMFCITKNITITGDPGGPQAGCGPNAPVIDGMGAYAIAFVLDSVSNVVIEGLEIENFSNDPSLFTGGVGSAIFAWNADTSNITINDNCMHDLGWNGVLVGSDDGSTQAGWVVRKNVISKFNQTGIELTNTNDSRVLFNIITGPVTITPWDIGDAGVGIEVATRDHGTGVSAHGINVIGNIINGPFAAGSRAGVNILSRAYALSSVAVLDGVEVRDNTITNTGTRGVYLVAERRNGGLANLSHIQVEKNNLTSNSVGAKLGLVTANPARVDGTYNIVGVAWNSITGSAVGIENNVSVSDSRIEKNTIWDNTLGIWLMEAARNNFVRRNTIRQNKDGIVVDGDWNRVFDNVLENNSGATGVHLNASASNNRMVGNFFVSNVPQAFDVGVDNKWNDTTRGNCWSDRKTNPGFPHTYKIDSDSIDYRPCGITASLIAHSKGGLVKIQDFTNFKKNNTKITATLNEKKGNLSGTVRITITATTNESKKIYANIRSIPDTFERFDKDLVKVSGIGMLNKVVKDKKGKIIEETDHNVNLTLWITPKNASVLAYAGPLLELNITGAKTSIFRFKEKL